MSDFKINSQQQNVANNNYQDFENILKSFFEEILGQLSIEIDFSHLNLSENGNGNGDGNGNDKQGLDNEKFTAFLGRIFNSGNVNSNLSEGMDQDKLTKILSAMSSSGKSLDADNSPMLQKIFESLDPKLSDKKLQSAETLVTELKSNKELKDVDFNSKETTLKKEKDSTDNYLLKDMTIGTKDSNQIISLGTEKSLDSEKNQLTKETAIFKNQPSFGLNGDVDAKNSVMIKDGVVFIQSPNGILSIDNANVIGAKGDSAFLENSRQFAHQSGYKEHRQSQQQGKDSDDERENEREQLDGIFFSGK